MAGWQDGRMAGRQATRCQSEKKRRASLNSRIGITKQRPPEGEGGREIFQWPFLSADYRVRTGCQAPLAYFDGQD